MANEKIKIGDKERNFLKRHGDVSFLILGNRGVMIVAAIAVGIWMAWFDSHGGKK